MATEPIGYKRLIETYHLPARPLTRFAMVDSAINGRQITNMGELELLRFESKYRPVSTLAGDLQFALRYEGINLEVLHLLFSAHGGPELTTWLQEQPESTFARRACYLYEWLTTKELDVTAAPKAAYVKVLDEKLQFGINCGARNLKFRVVDNLPGNRHFCPIVRKTEYLQAMANKDLRSHTRETIAKYDNDLLRRAAAFLYLKETHSSFEVEREKPSPDRARRFADLLREAENATPLSEKRLIELQTAVVDPRFREVSYRPFQNWIGEDLGYRKKMDLVPPRPDDVPVLMEGLITLSETLRKNPDCIDPVVAAASLAFGFVFIHPFMDGNGRLHRYLIHEVLSSNNFTPKGIVLPVSAVILANLDRYVHALERFSKPMMNMTSYDPDTPQIPAKGNDELYFRFFDATEQASFLYWALERTVEHDLEEEINFLVSFDAAKAALGSAMDWPPHSLDLFIRIVHQNGGKLSKAKYQSHFSWMTDEEAQRFESVVVDAFKSVNKTRH